jgi:hypothetical protein
MLSLTFAPQDASSTLNLKLQIRLGDMRGRAPLTTMLSLAFTPHDTLCGAEDGSIFLFSHDG